MDGNTIWSGVIHKTQGNGGAAKVLYEFQKMLLLQWTRLLTAECATAS